MFATTHAGTSASTNGDLYAFGPPIVSSFAPASGITGSVVTINGTSYVPGATVEFGALASPSVTFVSTAKLQAVVPNGAVAGKISVTNPAGTGSSATNFTPTLSITAFSPTHGPTGTLVTISGIGFNSGSKVRFNGTSATAVSFISSTQLRATAPAGGTTGPITVTNSTAPTGTVKSRAYYAYALPTVSSFSPPSGITGSQVTITGTNYVPGATVKFGASASPATTFVSTAQLKAVVPNGAVAGKISVTTPAGTGSSATNFTPTLSVTGFSPASGPTGTASRSRRRVQRGLDGQVQRDERDERHVRLLVATEGDRPVHGDHWPDHGDELRGPDRDRQKRVQLHEDLVLCESARPLFDQ